MLFVSSQIHWDGTNLIFKSRGNVILREGRWGRHLLSASDEPGSLQISFHSILILTRTSGTEDRIVTVLALRHVLLTDPVCLYFTCVNNKPHGPATNIVEDSPLSRVSAPPHPRGPHS